MKVILPQKSKWAGKDQKKADIATCFIGYGSPASSTEAYRKEYAKYGLANKTKYTKDDVIFASVEGARRGRIDVQPIIVELFMAKAFGAKVVTDNAFHAARPYNVGEREIEHQLTAIGFKVIESNQFYRIWQ